MISWVLTVIFLSAIDGRPVEVITAGKFDTYEACVNEGARSTGSYTRRFGVTFTCGKMEK